MRYQPLLTFLSVNTGVEMIKYQKQHLHSFQISPTSSSHGQRQMPKSPVWIFKAGHGIRPKTCPVPPGPYRHFWHPQHRKEQVSPILFLFLIPSALPQAALPWKSAPGGSHTLSAGFSCKSGVKCQAAGREDMNQYSICLITQGSQTRPWKHSAL